MIYEVTDLLIIAVMQKKAGARFAMLHLRD
jgi:hypothetical protein